MALRNIRHPNSNEVSDRFRRKADQEWDMAGLARQDGDRKAEEDHTRKAREYEQQYREALGL
jgi:hypothetical protein